MRLLVHGDATGHEGHAVISGNVGTCRRTTPPMAVADAGSSASRRTNVAHGTRAIAGWSQTYGITDQHGVAVDDGGQHQGLAACRQLFVPKNRV